MPTTLDDVLPIAAHLLVAIGQAVLAAAEQLQNLQSTPTVSESTTSGRHTPTTSISGFTTATCDFCVNPTYDSETRHCRAHLRREELNARGLPLKKDSRKTK